MTSLHSALAGNNLHEVFHFVLDHDPQDDGPVGADKYWLDTSATPYLIRRRNATDDGWIDVGGSGGSTIFERSFAYERQTPQTIPTGTDTAISFTATFFVDNGSFFSIATPTRFTVPADAVSDGRYLISASVRWAANATGLRKIWITKNGTAVWAQAEQPAPATAFVQNCEGMVECVGGDYFELFVRQESGGNLDAEKVDYISPVIRGYLIH